MPFGHTSPFLDVANAFQITGEKKEFIKPLDVPVSEGFRAELKFVLEEVYFNNSEFSLCENFVYPTLKEVLEIVYRASPGFGSRAAQLR